MTQETNKQVTRQHHLQAWTDEDLKRRMKSATQRLDDTIGKIEEFLGGIDKHRRQPQLDGEGGPRGDNAHEGRKQ